MIMIYAPPDFGMIDDFGQRKTTIEVLQPGIEIRLRLLSKLFYSTSLSVYFETQLNESERGVLSVSIPLMYQRSMISVNSCN